jgi:hypothetical protein
MNDIDKRKLYIAIAKKLSLDIDLVDGDELADKLTLEELSMLLVEVTKAVSRKVIK